MTPLSDDELHEALERRLSASRLMPAEREGMRREIDDRVAATSQRPRMFESLLSRRLPAAALVGVLAVVASIVLVRPSLPALNEGQSPEPGSPSAAPAGGVRVLSAEELASLLDNESAAGRVVLAEVDLQGALLSRCGSRAEQCWTLEIIEGDSAREVPIRSGDGIDLEAAVSAFRIELNALAYLGPVALNGEEATWTVPQVRQDADELGDVLVAVDGWLVESAAISCPAPNGETDMRYWCGGSWLTSDQEYMVGERRAQFRTSVADGLHLPWEAYDQFAPDPIEGYRGAEPRSGTYLIRQNGCPETIDGDCPVWEMLGRLEKTVVATAPPTPSATAEGTVVPSPVPLTPSPGTDAVSLARALAILDRWEHAVSSAPEGAIAFTGFVSYGGGWRGPDADEQKSAFLSGRVEVSVQLPTDVPPPGDVVWEDGSSATVPLLSAAEAFEQLRGGLAGGGCPECRPLEVIGARLITRGTETSRGWAAVPAWEFIFAERDAPIEPVSHVAVRDRIDISPIEDVARDMGYALGTPGSASLTVVFGGSACGPEHYAAEAVESELGVVVLVQPDPPPAPDATPQICRAMAVSRTAVVELDAPLGSRTVLDPASGLPIPIYREVPEGGFPRPDDQPEGSPPAIDCGSVRQVECDAALALVRDFAPDVLPPGASVVVDRQCGDDTDCVGIGHAAIILVSTPDGGLRQFRVWHMPFPQWVGEWTPATVGGEPLLAKLGYMASGGLVRQPSIPTELGGEPVLTAAAIRDHIAQATDDTPFLIGGALSPHFIADCYVPPAFPSTPLIRPCPQWPALDGLPLVLGDIRANLVPGGFYVLRVHVHDPRAEDCPPAYRERCERAVVVDEVAWQPDLGDDGWRLTENDFRAFSR